MRNGVEASRTLDLVSLLLEKVDKLNFPSNVKGLGILALTKLETAEKQARQGTRAPSEASLL